MASLGNVATAIAFNRFGLGGRPADTIPPDPVAWLIGQLAGPDPYTGLGMLSSSSCLALVAGYQKATNQAQQAPWLQQIQLLFNNEQSAFIANAASTTAPFRERLVWFWANHFAVSATSHTVQSVAGAFVREAIRPYVNGTFTEMLLAVMQHPAMIYSLNNELSAGPQSISVQRQQANGGVVTRGINENLARECLELHTVGLAANYTQADVDALAMLITGWSVNTTVAPYGFSFVANMHQPGSQVLMGNTFGADRSAGIAALTFLGTHPDTYQHLATELVTHFVSDTPAPGDIALVAQALASTGGNLGAAAAAVVNLPSAWQPYAKIRTPLDYAVAITRATGGSGTGLAAPTTPLNAAATMGQPLWQPPFPNGFSDIAADWAGPAQMLLRADWINALAALLTNIDPNATAGIGLGPLLRPTTAAAMAGATTLHDKLSLLFLSAEFQRR